MNLIKQLAKLMLSAIDIFALLLAVPAALILRTLRRAGLNNFRLTRLALLRLGVLPVIRHYYEPFGHPDDLRRPLTDERPIIGLDMNVDGQLALLAEFDYADELRKIPINADDSLTFGYENATFEGGDASRVN